MIEGADKRCQCDGVRPKCNTCQSKNLTCVYDVAEDGKTTTQLRAHVRRLAKELEDMKSVDEIKRALGVSSVWTLGGDFPLTIQDSNEQTPAIPEQDSFGTPSSEQFVGQMPNLGASSYDGSSREERQVQYQYLGAFGGVY
jgi:hypothetical protein